MDCSAKHTDRHQDDDDDDEEEEEEEDVGGIHTVEDVGVEDDDGDETKSLLPAAENGMLRSFDKGTRKVQWIDSVGDNLAEVLEFMPSESSENEDDDSNSCPCVIM